jgi:hypothetical protein
MLTEQIYKPMLRVRGAGIALAESAVLTYYTKSPHHLARLEASAESMGRALEDLRIALQAARSRGDDPLADDAPRGPTHGDEGIVRSDEEQRLVRRLLEFAQPQVDMQGTIQFFGLHDGDDAVRALCEALDALDKRTGFDRPAPSYGPPSGPSVA